MKRWMKRFDPWLLVSFVIGGLLVLGWHFWPTAADAGSGVPKLVLEISVVDVLTERPISRPEISVTSSPVLADVSELERDRAVVCAPECVLAVGRTLDGEVYYVAVNAAGYREWVRELTFAADEDKVMRLTIKMKPDVEGGRVSRLLMGRGGGDV